MERIQDAVAQARVARERHLADITLTPAETAARRLRTVAPFNEWSAAERLTLVAAGSPLDFAPGATVIRAGERDDKLYFLPEGALCIVTSDATARLLHAGEGPARHALDDAGVKTATVMAVHASRVFRISETELNAAMSARSVPAIVRASSNTRPNSSSAPRNSCVPAGGTARALRSGPPRTQTGLERALPALAHPGQPAGPAAGCHLHCPPPDRGQVEAHRTTASRAGLTRRAGDQSARPQRRDDSGRHAEPGRRRAGHDDARYARAIMIEAVFSAARC